MKKTIAIWIMLATVALLGGCGATGPAVQITTSSLPAAQVAAQYVAAVQARGGTAPYRWSVKQGSLPTGVTLDPTTGNLTGTPGVTGSFPVTLGVEDSSTQLTATTRSFTIKVSTLQVVITTTSLPNGTQSTAYSTTLAAANGVAPYNWSMTTGKLPAGLALTTAGMISGTPTQSGTFNFTTQVTDSSSTTATASFSVNIAATNAPSSSPSASTVQITTSSLPSGAQSTAYSASLAAANGVAPYSWSVAGGQLPAGLALTAGGQISGTPSVSGTFAFSVQATDSSNNTATASFSINIAGANTPVVNAISPSSGPISGGTTVTISGANFASGATVTFGGTAATSVTVSSASQIQAVSPNHIAGGVGIIVQANGQSSSSNTNFTYSATSPTVSGVSPNSGPTAGGTKVTITGTNFLSGALVTFGTTSATGITVTSATQIQATVPAGAAGITNVTVQDPGNLTSTLSGGFTYTSTSTGTPTITSVTPTSGTPGTTVTITGTNFESADSVTFGSTNAGATSFVSATQLTATVPSVSAGTYNITVTDPDPAQVTMNNGFTVTAATGGQSLLAGCTYTGAGGCSMPSGWTLVAQQDFECTGSHAVPANPSCATLPSTQTTSVGGNNEPMSSFEQTQAHGGSYAFGGQYTGDGGQINWILGQPQSSNSGAGLLGSFNTIYISYWEYTDTDAKYGNSDYYLFHMVSPTQCGGVEQDIAYDAQPGGGGGAAPVSTATMLPVANGNTGVSNCQGYYQWTNGAANLPMMAGQWRQVEIYYTPSTTYTGNQSDTPNVSCSSPSISGCGNGTLKLYINGQLSQQSLNANLNGNVSMNNSDVEVGGVITDFCDVSENTRANPFSICPAAAPAAFNRYFDDIIILKQ
jgi:IPT/TIG domain/Putative Ig domain